MARFVLSFGANREVCWAVTIGHGTSMLPSVGAGQGWHLREFTQNHVWSRSIELALSNRLASVAKKRHFQRISSLGVFCISHVIQETISFTVMLKGASDVAPHIEVSTWHQRFSQLHQRVRLGAVRDRCVSAQC